MALSFGRWGVLPFRKYRSERDPSRDPWGNNNNNEGPPDLDEVIAKLKKQFAGLFGGGKKPSDGGGFGGSGSGGSGSGASVGGFGIGLVLAVLVGLWLLSGFYTVPAAERGVVLRFGEYSRTTTPGLNWQWPTPIESVQLVNISQLKTLKHAAHMLTKDENIVNVDLAVQYRVDDPVKYLFQVNQPESTLRDATETSIREIVGNSKMDFVLTDGRTQIVEDARQLIQTILDEYKTGLVVAKVNLQDAQPPEQVQKAFDDVNAAQQDEERLKKQAEAYANQVVNNAKGNAARLIQEAEAYRARVIADAQGDVSRFNQLLAEYKKAPEVTRKRLYLDAMESVLKTTPKVLLDTDGGNNLVYLPLDRLMKKASGSDAAASPAASTGRSSAKGRLSSSPRSSSGGTLYSPRSTDRNGRELR